MLNVICFSLLVLMIAYHMQSSHDPMPHRHGSFAPVRKGCKAVWYVDGKEYMSAVADAIEVAETEVMITDWQMNPEIFMKRPDSGVDSLYWRLDSMLSRKAGEGIKVKILLYNEIKRAVDLGSDHVMELFEKNQNISVHRHPDFFIGLQTLFLWSNHEKIVIVDRSIAFVGGIDLCYGRWDTRDHELMDDYPIHPAVESHKALNESQHPRSYHARWIGKDYRNAFYHKEMYTDWDKPLEGYVGVEKDEIPRMPWHDVGCALIGKAVQDVVQHFTNRWDAATKPWWWRGYWDQNSKRVKQPIVKKNTKAEEIVSNSDCYTVRIQLLRSVDNWSAGQHHEASIYNAYIDTIKNAKHSIYIENQFFISSQRGFWSKVRNQIQRALVERIVSAHKAKENFHVMVIIPLKSEFSGDWDANDWSASTLRAVTFWNQATIFHGKDSLFSMLAREGILEEAAKKYFSVYSLRKYDLIGRHFVTEIVYVHSKIMIVDDRVAIIGSANINDRSMLGSRDSEVAVKIEDSIGGDINGVQCKMENFAHTLRCHLLKEHLGLVSDNEDGLKRLNVRNNALTAESFIKGVRSRAEKNTRLFVNGFGEGLLPRDDVKDYEMVKRCKGIPLPREDTPQATKIMKQIKGTLVNHPGKFLKSELNKPFGWTSLILQVVIPQAVAFSESMPLCIMAKADEDILLLLVNKFSNDVPHLWMLPAFTSYEDISDKELVTGIKKFVRREFNINIPDDQEVSHLVRDIYPLLEPLYHRGESKKIAHVLAAKPKKLTGKSVTGHSTEWIRLSELQEIADSTEDKSLSYNFSPPRFIILGYQDRTKKGQDRTRKMAFAPKMIGAKVNYP